MSIMQVMDNVARAETELVMEKPVPVRYVGVEVCPANQGRYGA